MSRKRKRYDAPGPIARTRTFKRSRTNGCTPTPLAHNTRASSITAASTTTRTPSQSPRAAVSTSRGTSHPHHTDGGSHRDQMPDQQHKFPELDSRVYKVHDLIGSGTYSEVYRGEIIKTHTLVAFKRLRKSVSPDRAVLEIKALHQLGGKSHVVRLLSVERLRDQVTLVMPFFKHQHFKTYFDQMEVPHVRQYMKALFESLSHLHDHDVLHRDIKPSNFLHSFPNDSFLLIDFGLKQNVSDFDHLPGGSSAMNKTLSKHVRLKNHKKQLVSRGGFRSRKRLLPRVNRDGTRGFRAPEVLVRCPHQTLAIDIWAAGVILLSIMTRKYPFFLSANDLTALAELGFLFGAEEMLTFRTRCGRGVWFDHSAVKRSWEKLCKTLSNKEWPATLYDLLKRCLELNPRTRITAQQALQHPFIQNSEQ